MGVIGGGSHTGARRFALPPRTAPRTASQPGCSMGCCPTVCRRSAVLLLELESAIWGVEHPSRTIPQGARQGGFRSENVFVYYEGTNTTVGMDRFAGYNMGEPDGIRGPKTARENGGLRQLHHSPSFLQIREGGPGFSSFW